MNKFLCRSILTALCVFVALESSADKIPAAVKSVVDLVSPEGVDAIKVSPLPNFYAVRYGNRNYYVADDGEHIFIGDLINVRDKVNYAERMRRQNNAATLAKLRSKMISFVPENEKYRVVVATDVNCGYCRKFHAHMPTLHRMGIGVDYILISFQGGDAGYDASVSVWCAADRRKALDAAKSGRRVKPNKCSHPLEENERLMSSLGMRGTPHIFLPDGTGIGGYVKPERLLAELRAAEEES